MLEGIELEDSLREALLDMIRKRLTPQAVKIRADIEVTCFQYEGIDAIKEALVWAALRGALRLSAQRDLRRGLTCRACRWLARPSARRRCPCRCARTPTCERLQAGRRLTHTGSRTQIQLIAPPLYVMLTSTMNKEAGVELMNQSIEAVRASIERAGGTLNVKVAVRSSSLPLDVRVCD